MVKVSFVLSASTASAAPIQFRQAICALIGSGGGARLVYTRVITSEYRSSDSDRSRAAVISAARSSSPRPSPQPSGRRRIDPGDPLFYRSHNCRQRRRLRRARFWKEWFTKKLHAYK